jgi:eukaryotic-like serine/threonine-protein kinase
MGEVWRGVHRAQGVPVAVKVITREAALTEEARAMFVREVRAMAGLWHPRVVMVLDHGVLPPGAGESSNGTLVAGSPYMVMELARGTLRDYLRKEPGWPRLHRALVSMLEALAHAHAMGVIHRDLKPANVLDFPDGLKLTDFGIAWSSRGDNPVAAALGTPRYMAPEQAQGDERSFGPWTDLYALGCVAWRLAAGAPVFSGPMAQVVAAHCRGELPAFVPRMRVPDGLESWLLRAMRRQPAERFRCAAEALASLEFLCGLPKASTVSGLGAAPVHQPTASGITLIPPVPSNAKEAPLQAPDRGASKVRMPLTWRRSVERTLPPSLLGAGLGRFGIRRVPFVAREHERDRCWAALAAVCAPDGGSGVLVLRGAAGTGKTRLAEWLCERAHEVGVAEVVGVSHGRHDGPMHGLGAAIERQLRCVGLSRQRLAPRLAGWFDDTGGGAPAELGALVELLRPLGDNPATLGLPTVSLRDLARRHEVVAGWLARLARDRPVLLSLDDAQWGEESLSFVQSWMAVQARPPVLFVLTVRSDELREAVGDQVRALPHALVVDVVPLSGSSRGAMVRGMLGLQGDLAERVESRTAGNPLFAVQLVRDWVDRGVLEVGTGGFRLKRGAKAWVPDAVHGLWAGRVERLLTGRPSSWRVGLELAALLGEHVAGGEWRAVCAQAGFQAPAGLWESLVVAGLSTSPTPQELRFAHGMLAESIVRMASEAGRGKAARSACADVLEKLGREEIDLGQLRLAEQTLGRALAIARSPELGGSAHAHLLGLHGDVLRQLGRTDQGLAELERAVSDCRERGDRVTMAPHLTSLGVVYHQVGRVAEAKAAYQEAIGLLDQRGDAKAMCIALGEFGRHLFECGSYDEALAQYVRGGELAQRMGDRKMQGRMLANVGTAHFASDRPELAERAYVAAVARHRATSDRRFEGSSLGNLGTVLKRMGRVAEAREAYEAALEIHQETGHLEWEIAVRVNLAGFHTILGFLEEAEEQYRAGLDAAERLGSPRMQGAILCNHGNFLHHEGRGEEALHVLRAGLARSRQAGDPRFAALTLGNLGALHLSRGEHRDARTSLVQALALADELGSRRLRGWFLLTMAEVNAAEGVFHEVDDMWTEAAQLLVSAKDAQGMAEAHCVRARLCLGRGEREVARTSTAMANKALVEMGLGPHSALSRSVAELQEALREG